MSVSPWIGLLRSTQYGMEAKMGRVLDVLSKHTQIDKDTIETELFAAIRALEIDPEKMTVDELRECLLLYLDEVFYGTSPDKVQ